MFNKDFDINGEPAEHLKYLCELRTNVPNREQYDNFKIFHSYVDAYVLCPLIGYKYSRRVPMGLAKDGSAGILTEALTSRFQELKFVYQIIMLIDAESEPDVEKRVYRAFNLSEETDDEKEFVMANMKIFNEYFFGGVEVLYEDFVLKCTEKDKYLRALAKFVNNYDRDNNIEKLNIKINEYLNQ